MPETKQIKVFIVEDDFIFIEILAGMLDSLNEELISRNIKITYKTFYSNSEAEFELRQNPDIILLDYFIVDDELNEDTALKFLLDIREHDSSIDVIIVSGQENPAIKEDLLMKGAVAYISKEQDSLMTLKPVLMEIIEKRLS